MSDACIESRALVDEYQVPTISSGASADIGGDWYFNVQHGSIPDEGYIIANWLVREGHERVAVTWDTAYHAGEYLRHFRAAARRAGIDIVGERRFSQLITQQAVDGATDAVAHLRQSNADALVHLGTGFSGNHIAAAVQAADWDIPRIMNDAFYASAIPEMAGPFEGWVGIAGWDEENPTWSARYAEYQRWLEQNPQDGVASEHPEMFAVWYTLTTAACEGIALAPVLSHDGLRRGLESVSMLPSAVGGPGTVVSWSHHNHRGLRGANLYVLRKIVGGRSVMEMRYDPVLAG
jgi:ABC-type branched-subunit amino acid transport system substrate-binding protein